MSATFVAKKPGPSTAETTGEPSASAQPAPPAASSINGLKMSKKRRVAPGRDWPSELKGPFPMQEIIDQATEAHPIPATDEDSHFNMEEQQAFYVNRDARRLALAEIKRRVALLADSFGMRWPENEDGWLELIFDAFERCEAPGFKVQAKTAGAPEKWSSWKNAQLFADVRSVVTKTGLSESAAVNYIATNPKKFLDRYNEKYTTLRRQFLRAKNEFEELDRTHPGPVLWLMTRKEMIKHMIDTYSAEAERKR